VVQHPKCIEGSLTLDSMTVTDGTTADSLYPTLIKAIRTNELVIAPIENISDECDNFLLNIFAVLD
jgi:hypothetical protein